jgi:hypothetical protein
MEHQRDLYKALIEPSWGPYRAFIESSWDPHRTLIEALWNPILNPYPMEPNIEFP